MIEVCGSEPGGRPGRARLHRPHGARERQPRDARGTGPDVHRDRRARRGPERPRSRAGAAPPPRPPRQRAPRALARRAPAERPARRAARRMTTYLGTTGREETLDEIQEFLTGTRYEPEPDGSLATVLFTDIVDSTRTAARARRPAVARGAREPPGAPCATALARFGGREVKTLGDGFLPRSTAGPRDPLRAGRSSTPREELGDPCSRGSPHRRVRGDGGRPRRHRCSHRRARQRARGPSEVLVSRTVKDLVAGSGIEFERPRRPRAQGRSGHLGAARGQRLTGPVRRPTFGKTDFFCRRAAASGCRKRCSV